MTWGASTGRLPSLVGEGGDASEKDNSGQERGDSGMAASAQSLYVGMDWSCVLMNWARFAE